MSRAARAVGLLCGLAAAAFAVHSWAVASTGPGLGADVTIAAVAPGELALSGSGAVLQASGLHPGDGATGSLRLRNITGEPLLVRIRTLASTPELDDALELTATAQGREIAAGSTGDLRRWSTRSVLLGVRRSALLRLSARQRRPAEGLIADVTLEFRARAVARR